MFYEKKTTLAKLPGKWCLELQKKMYKKGNGCSD